MSGAAVRPHQGLSAGLSRLHQRHHHAAARGAGARHRPVAEAARRAEGLDAASGRRSSRTAGRGRQRAVHGKLHARAQCRPAQAAGALLAPQGRRALHRLRLDRHHARPGRRLDQRLDLSRAGARQEPGDDPVRPSRPPRRDHRQEILGQGQALPGRRGQRRGPGAVHRRLRIPARRPVGIRLRRRDQRRAARGDRRPRSPDCRCRRRPRSSSKASCCRPARSRCRKARSASSPATTPPRRGPAR